MSHSKEFLVQRLIGLKERPHMNGYPWNILYSAKFLVHIILRIQNGGKWEVSQTSSWWNANLNIKHPIDQPFDLPLAFEVDKQLFALLLEMMRKIWYAISQQYYLDNVIKHEIENLLFSKKNDLQFFSDAKSLELALYHSFLTCNLENASGIREIYVSLLRQYRPGLTKYSSYWDISISNQFVDSVDDRHYIDVVQVIEHILAKLS